MRYSQRVLLEVDETIPAMKKVSEESVINAAADVLRKQRLPLFIWSRYGHIRRRLMRRNSVDTSRMPTASEPATPTVSRPFPTASIMLPSSPMLMV